VPSCSICEAWQARYCLFDHFQGPWGTRRGLVESAGEADGLEGPLYSRQCGIIIPQFSITISLYFYIYGINLSPRFFRTRPAIGLTLTSAYLTRFLSLSSTFRLTIEYANDTNYICLQSHTHLGHTDVVLRLDEFYYHNCNCSILPYYLILVYSALSCFTLMYHILVYPIPYPYLILFYTTLVYSILS
jgi:hypothetical protein